MATRSAIFAASLLALVGGSSAATCKAKDLKKSLPEIFGVEILDVKANEVEQWNDYATSAPTVPFLPAAPEPIDFCNVFVEYTHPGKSNRRGSASLLYLTCLQDSTIPLASMSGFL